MSSRAPLSPFAIYKWPLFLALIIALASVLQAAFGGAVLRKALGYPAPLDNPRDLLLFLLLSPIFCLTSASC